MSIFNQLKRRNVICVAAAYLVVTWLVIQVSETIFPLFGFDDAPARIILNILVIGFFPAMVFAWAFEMTPDGMKKEKDVDRSQAVSPRTGKKTTNGYRVWLSGIVNIWPTGILTVPEPIKWVSVADSIRPMLAIRMLPPLYGQMPSFQKPNLALKLWSIIVQRRI